MRTLLLMPLLALLLVALGSASYVHAAYSPSDISEFSGGGDLYPPHCGPGGSGTSGGYWNGGLQGGSYPPGFLDNPSNYCFWETEKVINTCDFGYCGLDTVNNYGWEVFPGPYNGSGISGLYCGEAAVLPGRSLHDICTNTGFRIIAPTASLAASPSTVNARSSVALTWSSAHATSCTGTGFSTGGAVSGTVTVTPSASQTYSVSCTGAGGTASASANVTVVPAALPPTASIAASPKTVAPGAAASLTWSSTNATSCTSSDFSVPGNAPSGTASTGALASTRTFTITCTGPGGSAHASDTVTVQAARPAQQASLSASPARITQGQTATLFYQCSPAAPANILPSVGTLGSVTPSNPNPSVASGSITVSPGQTTTYTLNCYGDSIVSSSATVTVTGQQNICVANQGAFCAGPSNSCGIIANGSIQCNGTCNAPTPPESLCQAPTPPNQPPTASLSASPLSVLTGGSSMLTWSSTNASSCSGFGFNTGGAPSGSQSTGPLASTASYGLLCTGQSGSANAQPVTVTVGQLPSGGGPSCTGPASAALSSDASPIKEGTVAHLTVDTANILGACTLTGTNGFSKTVHPDSCDYTSGPIATPPATNQTIYTLSCSGTPATKTIVNVIPFYREF